MSNRVALVTGGAQGIGKGIAVTLGADGFKVVIADLNLDVAEQTAKEITAAGGEAVAVQMDVTSAESVAAAIASVSAELGPVEVLVNNAGFGLKGRFLDNSLAQEQAHLDVLVVAVMRLTHAALGPMVTAAPGRW